MLLSESIYYGPNMIVNVFMCLNRRLVARASLMLPLSVVVRHGSNVLHYDDRSLGPQIDCFICGLLDPM